MLALIMTLGILPAISIPVRAATPEPNYTWYDSDPNITDFTISTADELAGLAQLVNGGTDFTGKTIKLTADINLSTYTNWEPIGDEDNPFAATFNGNGKVIENLTIINSSTGYVGLFGYIDSDGAVMNLGIASGTVTSDSDTVATVGGVVGQNSGTMTVTFSRGLTSGENNYDRTIFYRDSSGKVQKSGVGKYHARKNGVNYVVSFTFTDL